MYVCVTCACERACAFGLLIAVTTSCSIWLRLVLTDILLRDIAKDVGKDWKMLSRELEVPETEIQAILHRYPFDLHEQSYQSLKLWKEIGDTHATAIVLYKALKRQHLNSIAHKYFHNSLGEPQL